MFSRLTLSRQQRRASKKLVFSEMSQTHATFTDSDTAPAAGAHMARHRVFRVPYSKPRNLEAARGSSPRLAEVRRFSYIAHESRTVGPLMRSND